MKIVQSEPKVIKRKNLHPLRRFLFHLGYILFIIGLLGSIKFEALPAINEYYYWGISFVGFLLFVFNLSEQNIIDGDVNILHNKE